MARFESLGRLYDDCWIETTVRQPGGRNRDGLYVLGHYPDYETAYSALQRFQAEHPKALSFLVLKPAAVAAGR